MAEEEPAPEGTPEDRVEQTKGPSKQTAEEEALEQLQAEKKAIEGQIVMLREHLSEVSEQVRELAPKVASIRAQREWIEGEPARAAMRATPEYQEWYRRFKEGALPWQQSKTNRSDIS